MGKTVICFQKQPSDKCQTSDKYHSQHPVHSADTMIAQQSTNINTTETTLQQQHVPGQWWQ